MPWKPRFPGERPTLGYLVLEWIEENLAQPGIVQYEPLVLTREQAEFVLAFYELDPITGRRIIRRAVLSRARGWGKSPLMAALALAEALGPVCFGGWDADGRPVGVPWSTRQKPIVLCAAVSEAQVRNNTWEPLLDMVGASGVDAPVLDNYPGLEPLGTRVNCPVGFIGMATASAATIKGTPHVFATWDQTEEWQPETRGIELAKVMGDNAAKAGGSWIETPNAYVPGRGSVAERSAKAARDIAEGRARINRGFLYDHREAPADTDIRDHKSLIQGLRVAYGDSSAHPDGCVIHDPPCKPGWRDLEDIVTRVWSPDVDEQDARAMFLGQITHASDSFISEPMWGAIAEPEKALADGDTITLGFDGSRGRAQGKPDATAIVACRVSDGLLVTLGVWEASDDDAKVWVEWEPNITEVEAVIRDAFTRYRVAGFYADPADWRSHVNKWEAEYGAKVAVHARGASHPFEWWMTGGRATKVQDLVLAFYGAIANRDICHAGDLTLTRHMLNARRRLSHKKLALGKESDISIRKIDAAVAAMLAFQARLDALAAGEGKPREKRVRRVRKLR